MPQQPVLQILTTVAGINQLAIGSLSHGVDGQITTQQIILDGDIGAGVKDKTLMTATLFAFGACQRIFGLAFGMQEHRKMLSHRLVTQRLHLFRRGTGDNVIPVTVGNAKHAVADRPADQISVH